MVITSVNRDDLSDGGAAHFRDCINEVRRQCPDMRFEILTPDFRDNQQQAIDILEECLPFVFAHNVETVPALYKTARAGGDYRRSLNLLKIARDMLSDIHTKSSIMLGLGEEDSQVIQVLRDLREVGCDRITIGQYLKPSKDSLEVVEYITPEKFDWWKSKAHEIGFSWVMSAPIRRVHILRIVNEYIGIWVYEFLDFLIYSPTHSLIHSGYAGNWLCFAERVYEYIRIWVYEFLDSLINSPTHSLIHSGYAGNWLCFSNQTQI